MKDLKKRGNDDEENIFSFDVSKCFGVAEIS